VSSLADLNLGSKPVLATAIAESEADVVCGDSFTQQLVALAARVARTDVTVLISGPTGAGKEVLARFIHRNSQRGQGRFVPLNCACLPESMVEDILFGHERGAFTGALQRYEGLFSQADGGTLLLDEIGELPLLVQAKLLRVLQEREFTPLGSTKSQRTNFRLLAATNRNLKADVQAGKFREDLYYRINIFPLTIKPLWQRRGDILPLSIALLRKHRSENDSSDFDSSAIDALHAYDWPGNVRELENAIQRALVVADGSPISSGHLGLEQKISVENNFILSRPEPEQKTTPAKATSAGRDFVAQNFEQKITGQDDSLAIFRASREAELIVATLRDFPTKAIAAAKLGISERTLRYKLARIRELGFNGIKEVSP